jgi:hypothetical protein
MEPAYTMDTKNSELDIETKSPIDTYDSAEVGQVIEIDPAREAAARRKFDLYVLPVSVIFLVLSSLDRNNVSDVFVPQVSLFLTVH